MRCCGFRAKTIRCRRRAVSGFYCRRCTWQGIILLFSIPIGFIMYNSDLAPRVWDDKPEMESLPATQLKIAEMTPVEPTEEAATEKPQTRPMLAVNDTQKVTPFAASSMTPFPRRTPPDHRTATPSDGSFDLLQPGPAPKTPTKKRPKFRLQF